MGHPLSYKIIVYFSLPFSPSLNRCNSFKFNNCVVIFWCHWEQLRVCDICGDSGREDLLAICGTCSDGAEHMYVLQNKSFPFLFYLLISLNYWHSCSPFCFNLFGRVSCSSFVFNVSAIACVKNWRRFLKEIGLH